MCLDDKNLKNSATKIYVFKCLLDEINDPCYETAK